jgi:myxalamid-type polyketide synthase MxaB
MDALMAYRQQLGLPALSVNWGGWSEVGMAAQMDETELNRLAARGENLISPEQGQAILATLIQQKQVQIAALPVNWSKYIAATNSQNNALISSLATNPTIEQTTTETVQTGWLKTLTDAPETEHYALLLENLRSMLAQILGLPSPEKIGLRQGLRDLGLDSILSIEVRGKLEIELDTSLPATLLFDYPTLETLTDYLSKNYLGITSPGTQQTEKQDDAALLLDDDLSDLLADIDQISDMDIQQQFSQKN